MGARYVRGTPAQRRCKTADLVAGLTKSGSFVEPLDAKKPDLWLQARLFVVCPGFQAAARRSVERKRIGLPPGGLRGPPPSSADSASRMSSM